MSVSYSSLELEGISRNPFEADSETVKGVPSRSIHFRAQDALPDGESNGTSYLSTEHNDQAPLHFRPRKRRRKWCSIANHCNACCFVSATIVALVIIPLSVGVTSNYIGADFPGFGVCEPDGNFNTGLDPVSVWSPSKAFQITLGFGSFTFPTAKFIDIVWDIAIGRGGQGLLGFIMYRAFTKSLARQMERSSVSFGTFEAVALQGVSVRAWASLVEDYFTNSGVRAKLTVSWMIFALSYVLIFPTLMSAMTGYSATTQPYIQTPDGNEVEWSSFRQVNYIIYDGWRVGLTGSYLVNAVSKYASADPSNYWDANVCSEYWIDLDGVVELFGDQKDVKKCLLTIAVSQYAETYGFNSMNDTSSTFSPDNSTFFNLTAPTLNISAFFVYPGAQLFGSGSYKRYASPRKATFTNASLARFARVDQPENRTYDIPYIRDNGRCQQRNTYQWGFSFLLLFSALLLSSTWALGMWAMWLDAYYNSQIDAVGERDMGSWRAVIDLAEGIAASLNNDPTCGQDTVGEVIAGTRHLGDREIRRRIKRESGRGRIGYADLVGPDNAVITRSVRVKRWLEKRRWGRWLLRWRGWVIAGVSLAVFGIAVVYPVSLSYAH